MTDEELQAIRAALNDVADDHTHVVVTQLLDEVARLRALADSHWRLLDIAVRPDIHARELRRNERQQAELDRMRPVYEAAKTFQSSPCSERNCRDDLHDDECPHITTMFALCRTVEAALAKEPKP